MVNTEYGKVKLSLTLHFNEYNKFRLLLDGKEPVEFENTEKAINYVFEAEVGNHILTFESIPFEKNQLGKMRFSFLFLISLWVRVHTPSENLLSVFNVR